MIDIVDHNPETGEVVSYNFKQIIAIQYHLLFPVILKTYIPIVLLLLSIVIVSKILGTYMGKYFKDLSNFSHLSHLTGLISNIGIIFWCASATLCFFCSAFVKSQFHESLMPLFLLYSGFLTSILLFDDFFMFHDYIFPVFFHINERQTYLSYLIITLAYLIIFRKLILNTEFLLVFLALGFFGLLLGFDFFSDITHSNIMDGLFEDGTKFFGIVTWLTYFARLCFQYLKSFELTCSQ